MKFLKTLIVCFATSTFAQDWAMWQYDANRSANSAQKLDTNLSQKLLSLILIGKN